MDLWIWNLRNFFRLLSGVGRIFHECVCVQQHDLPQSELQVCSSAYRPAVVLYVVVALCGQHVLFMSLWHCGKHHGWVGYVVVTSWEAWEAGVGRGFGASWREGRLCNCNIMGSVGSWGGSGMGEQAGERVVHQNNLHGCGMAVAKIVSRRHDVGVMGKTRPLISCLSMGSVVCTTLSRSARTHHTHPLRSLSRLAPAPKL